MSRNNPYPWMDAAPEVKRPTNPNPYASLMQRPTGPLRMYADVTSLSSSLAGTSNTYTLPDLVRARLQAGRMAWLIGAYINDGYSPAFDVSPAQPVYIKVSQGATDFGGKVILTSNHMDSVWAHNPIFLRDDTLTILAYFAGGLSFSPCFVFGIDETG